MFLDVGWLCIICCKREISVEIGFNLNKLVFSLSIALRCTPLGARRAYTNRNNSKQILLVIFYVKLSGYILYDTDRCERDLLLNEDSDIYIIKNIRQTDYIKNRTRPQYLLILYRIYNATELLSMT